MTAHRAGLRGVVGVDFLRLDAVVELFSTKLPPFLEDRYDSVILQEMFITPSCFPEAGFVFDAVSRILSLP